MKRYLIIGTGGVGGSIAGFLALAGKDVTCIARGKHLDAIRRNGLHLKSDLKGEHFVQVKAETAENFNGKADVIFVCVKGYSIDSVKEVIERASTPETLVIPILNVFGTGEKIARLAPSATVLDGCIYIVGFVSGEGEITQMGTIFRMVFGERSESRYGVREHMEAIAGELRECGIKVDVSDHIERDTFIKWAFISAMACTGAYHQVSMGEVQHPGEVRDTFVGLSEESAAIGRKLNLISDDAVAYNLKVIDKLDPNSTSSMQKDLAKGHESEIQGLLFDMISLGERLGIDMPVYRKVALKFQQRQ